MNTSQRCAGGLCVCDALLCPNGCCDYAGRCQGGASSTNCGDAGYGCSICGAGQTCYGTVCCTPSCVDGGIDGGDGCGGKCEGTSCLGHCGSGCCTSQGSCASGNDDHFCGNAAVNGGICQDCTDAGQVCVKLTNTCCTPSCDGLACNASDGCGGYCPEGYGCDGGPACLDGYCPN